MFTFQYLHVYYMYSKYMYMYYEESSIFQLIAEIRDAILTS